MIKITVGIVIKITVGPEMINMRPLQIASSPLTTRETVGFVAMNTENITDEDAAAVLDVILKMNMAQHLQQMMPGGKQRLGKRVFRPLESNVGASNRISRYPPQKMPPAIWLASKSPRVIVINVK